MKPMHLLLLALVAGGGYLYWRSRQTPPVLKTPDTGITAREAWAQYQSMLMWDTNARKNPGQFPASQRDQILTASKQAVSDAMNYYLKVKGVIA